MRLDVRNLWRVCMSRSHDGWMRTLPPADAVLATSVPVVDHPGRPRFSNDFKRLAVVIFVVMLVVSLAVSVPAAIVLLSSQTGSGESTFAPTRNGAGLSLNTSCANITADAVLALSGATRSIEFTLVGGPLGRVSKEQSECSFPGPDAVVRVNSTVARKYAFAVTARADPDFSPCLQLRSLDPCASDSFIASVHDAAAYELVYSLAANITYHVVVNDNRGDRLNYGDATLTARLVLY